MVYKLRSSSKKNIRLLLAYDGTHFFGWQKNHSIPSIEGTLQPILEKILQEPITLQAASRTDRGVHAKEQVVNFFTSKPPPKQLSINRLLPPSIKILNLSLAPLSFHPSLDVVRKKYTYALCLGPLQLPFNRYFSWHVPYPLNLETMKAAASYLVGTHDFSALCNQCSHQTYTDCKRTIDSILFFQPEPKRLLISVTGNHFLYKMVRNLIGLLISVGKKELQVSQIPHILASKQRAKANITAPAHGLTLDKIYYSL